MTPINPVSRRRSLACGLLLSGLVLVVPGAQADDDRELRFDVAAGITAHAVVTEDGQVGVTTSRFPRRQVLEPASDADGSFRLVHDDYNFDGFQDLASTANVGQVNEEYAIYLYDPASGGFVPMAAVTSSGVNCDGYWSVQADAATRTLTSSCRSGPMWYTDIYRFDAGKPYLFRTMKLAHLDSEQLARVLDIGNAEDADVLSVWSTRDPAGRVLEQVIGNGLDAPDSSAPLQGRSATVVPARLALYSRSGDASTRRYLVKGDAVELLDGADDWVQVRYRNPSRGPITGWVKLPDQP